MLERLKTLALVACLGGFAAPALAQETTGSNSDAAAPAAEPADGEVTLLGDLSEGQEVGTEPKIGDTYVVEETGDWRVQCLKTEAEQDPCQLYQLLKDEAGGSVAEVSIFRLPEGGRVVAGATFIVPLETLLTAQLTVAVDGGKAKRYPYSFCNQIGCYARVGLTQEDVDGFKRGAKATLTIVPFAAPDQKVLVTMSLAGFTAGLPKASVVQN